MVASSVASRIVRTATALGVAVAALVLPGTAQAAEKRVEAPGTFSVTRLTLQQDGSVRVTARLECNARSTTGVLRVGVGLEQKDKISGDGGLMPCTGKPQRLKFKIPAPAGGGFRAGEAVLYPDARLECPSPGPSDPDNPSDDGYTVQCSPGFTISGTVLVTLAPKKASFVGPQINISGMRLTSDGAVALDASFICGSETVGLGGQVEQSTADDYASGWYGFDTNLCTGRWQRQQVVVVSETGVPFQAGRTDVWAGISGHETQEDPDFTMLRSQMYSEQTLLL